MADDQSTRGADLTGVDRGPRRAAVLLERALLATIVIHLVAMLAMAVWLLPGVPGGTPAGVAERTAYIAAHPWAWRLGWLPWHLTALSDLVLAIALVRTPWIPRLPATLALAATIVAIGIEQPNEIRWSVAGVDLARRALESGSLEGYRAFEAATFRRVSLWAAAWYTAGAIGWSWAFAAAGTWTRVLTAISIGAWGSLLAASVLPLLPWTLTPSAGAIALGNAVGFVLMIAWFLLVTEEVLRRSRPIEAHGRYAPWRYPRRGAIGAIVDAAANARVPRSIGELLPSPAFISDVTDVVYVNYLVPASRLEPFVPAGLELQRLGPARDRALFSVLTFRHGHFGPRLLGPLRRLLPSPIQSNWRIHVRDPQTHARGIYFVTTAIASLPNAIAARYLAEGVPMHVPRGAALARRSDGSVHVRIDPGGGSAPDLDADLDPSAAPAWTPPWSEAFAGMREFLEYCVPQDRAMSAQPWYDRVCRQEIRLGIPIEACEPLAGTVSSRAAAAIAGEATPICFRVGAVAFRYDREQYDRRVIAPPPPVPAHSKSFASPSNGRTPR